MQRATQWQPTMDGVDGIDRPRGVRVTVSACALVRG